MPAAPVAIRIRYRGLGSLDQRSFAPPRPEIVHTVHMYDAGDEIARIRPGWFVHETMIEDGVLTWIVEVRPPGWHLPPE